MRSLALFLLIPLVSLTNSTLTPSSDAPIDSSIDTVPRDSPPSEISLTTLPHGSSTDSTGDSSSLTRMSPINGDSSLAPPPSPSGSAQKAPSAIASGSFSSDETSSKSTPEETEQSLDELKKQWEDAANYARTMNESLQSAEGKLKDKEDAAFQAEQTYGEKKRKWEELEKIAKEKELAFSEPLIKANAEFKIAEDFYKSAKDNFTAAETALTVAQGKFNTATAKLAEIEGRPERLRLANDKKKANTDRTTLVNGLKDQSQADFTEKETAYNDAKQIADDKTNKYNAARCDEPAKKDSAECKRLRTSKTTFDGLLATARNAFVPVNTTMTGYEEELAALRLDLPLIQAEINAVTQLIDEQDPGDLDRAKNLVTRYTGEVATAQPIYNAAKPIFDDAEAEFGKKRDARDAAQALVDAGFPADVTAARDQAADAREEEVEAGNALEAINEQIESLKSEVRTAQNAYDVAQSVADSLKKRYDARRRDEEARKGISGAQIGMMVFFPLAAIVTGVVLFFCWRRRLCCFKKLKAGKRGAKPNEGPSAQSKKSSKAKNGTPSAVSSTSNAALASASQVSVRPGDEAPPTPGATPLPAGDQLQYNVQPGDPTFPVQVQPVDMFNQPPEKKGVIPLFKIPGRCFEWCGGLRRSSRWHGAPNHDMDGVEGVKKIDNVIIGPTGHTVTEIGAGSEIIVNTGPASDSDRTNHPLGFLYDLSAYCAYEDVLAATGDPAKAQEAFREEMDRIMAINMQTEDYNDMSTTQGPETTTQQAPKRAHKKGSKSKSTETKNKKKGGHGKRKGK